MLWQSCWMFSVRALPLLAKHWATAGVATCCSTRWISLSSSLSKQKKICLEFLAIFCWFLCLPVYSGKWLYIFFAVILLVGVGLGTSFGNFWVLEINSRDSWLIAPMVISRQMEQKACQSFWHYFSYTCLLHKGLLYFLLHWGSLYGKTNHDGKIKYMGYLYPLWLFTVITLLCSACDKLHVEAFVFS